MIRVSIEVRDGTGCFNVAARAESISRAVEIVADRYPGRDIRVEFPIDPEGFFVGDPLAKAGVLDEPGQPETLAA